MSGDHKLYQVAQILEYLSNMVSSSRENIAFWQIENFTQNRATEYQALNLWPWIDILIPGQFIEGCIREQETLSQCCFFTQGWNVYLCGHKVLFICFSMTERPSV